jgi:hypothetical protein
VYYRNLGSSSQYNFQEESFDDIQVGNNSAPELMNWDNDGDLDLVLGSAGDGLIFYKNDSNNNFHFQQSSNLEVPFLGMNTKPALGKLFEGKLDIIVGVSTGGLYHLQKEACPLQGDPNDDGGFNVLDIVIIANCVLAGNCGPTETNDCIDDNTGEWTCIKNENENSDHQGDPNGCAADINNDGAYNILDIVALSNCVLANNCGN